jgi:hypothetical protein
MNRNNGLRYKTLKGAHVGDLFMSLIHTCELNGVNPFATHGKDSCWIVTLSAGQEPESISKRFTA